MVGRPRLMGRLRKTAIAGAMGVMLVVPAPAFAGSTAQDAYDIPGGSIEEAIPPPPTPPPPTPPPPHKPPPQAITQARGGSLPFTGLDLGLMVGAGAMLLALGLGMRRLSRPSRESA
jgi:hypothetical protein